MRVGIPAAVLGSLLMVSAIAGCGVAVAQVPHQARSPRATPTPPPLVLGVLPLGGVAPEEPSLVGPYEVQGKPLSVPSTVTVAQTPASPATAVGDLASELGVPGPPVNTGDGLAYNLGSTTGYQLTTSSNLLQFNFHPNTPVDETGATPSVAGAEQFAEQFLGARHVPGARGGVLPLPELTQAHAADRRVFFQWTQDGYPAVTIEGQPEEMYVDVAANYQDHLSLVGISGAVPFPIVGPTEPYPSMSVATAVKDLNLGLINPNSYLLQSDLQPYPTPTAAAASSVAVLTGAALAVVYSAGFAVPVLVFQVSGRPPSTQFVVCAAATFACAPLRYSLPSPTATAPTPG